MYSQVVLRNFRILPHDVFMTFLLFELLTAFISLYRIYLIVFVMEANFSARYEPIRATRNLLYTKWHCDNRVFLPVLTVSFHQCSTATASKTAPCQKDGRAKSRQCSTAQKLHSVTFFGIKMCYEALCSLLLVLIRRCSNYRSCIFENEVGIWL